MDEQIFYSHNHLLILTFGHILLFIILVFLCSPFLYGYSDYGAPSEFGNDSETTCYIGGDPGIVNCTGNAIFGGSIDVSDWSGIPDVWLNVTGDTGTGNFIFEKNLTIASPLFFVDSDLNMVGINTLNPSHRLNVIGSANFTGTVFASNYSGNSPIIFINSSNGFEFMRIADSGNVGIGTSAPSTALDVFGAINSTELYVSNASMILSEKDIDIIITNSSVPDISKCSAGYGFRIRVSYLGGFTSCSNFNIIDIIDDVCDPFPPPGDCFNTFDNVTFYLPENITTSGSLNISLDPAAVSARLSGVSCEFDKQNYNIITVFENESDMCWIDSVVETYFMNESAAIILGDYRIYNSRSIEEDGLFFKTLDRPYDMQINNSNGFVYFPNGIKVGEFSGENIFMSENITGYGNLNINNTLYLDAVNSNVGIGTTSPDASLDVEGDVEFNLTTGSKNFTVVNGSGSTRFVIDNSNGNVGIGTSVPRGSLDIFGSVWINNHIYLGEDILHLNVTAININESATFTNKSGVVKILLNASGHSWFTGGNVGIGTTSPDEKLTIVGNQNLTGNLSVDGFLHTGNDSRNVSSIFSQIGDAYFGNRVVADGSISGWAGTYGIALMALENDGKYNFTSTDGTATVNGTTQYICDNINPFATGHVGMFLSVIDSTPSYTDATGKIITFINTTCIGVSFASSGDSIISDASALSYYVYPPPVFVALDNGFVSSHIGVNPDTKFEINIPDGKGFHSFYIDDTAGIDQHQAATIDVDFRNYTGIVGSNIYMASSAGAANIHIDNTFLEIDLINVNNSKAHFIDINLISNGSNNDIDVISVSGNVNHLIHLGSEDSIELAWKSNITGNYSAEGNFSSEISDLTLFEGDNDAIYIGGILNFTSISISLGSVSSADILAEIYYCNSSTEYEALSILDTTNGLRISGTISFVNPSNRGKCNHDLNNVVFSNDTNLTYVAIKRTKNNIVNPPVENLITVGGATNLFILQQDMIRIQPATAPPETCTASFEGAIYSDSDLNLPCFCNGANWLQMDDFSSVCS